MSLGAALESASVWLIPCLMGGVGLLLLGGRRARFDDFVAGATEGARTAVRLLPTLTALLVAVGMLRASGAVETVAGWLSPALSRVGVPSELVPLLLTRPFSGSAATASYSALLSEVGADSFVAACATVVMGSSDTAVYVISVYFSSVGVKKTRHALPLALALMLLCVFLACFLCRVCLR